MLKRKNKKMNKKHMGMLLTTISMFFFAILIGPMDCFTHGYFCDVAKYDQIPAEGFVGQVSLEKQDFVMEFSPVKSHFVGFQIKLINQLEGNTGELYLTIYDKDDKQVDEITVDISKVASEAWYHTYINADLRQGVRYKLRISARNCETFPCLQIVEPNYLSDENISGNLLIGYAYAASTFTFQNKVLICLFLVAIWGILCEEILLTGKCKKLCGYAAVFFLMTAVLSWNYMYNSMNNHNTGFGDFQSDSEKTVVEPIDAVRKGVWFTTDDQMGYGLGTYNTNGELRAYKSQYGLQGKIFCYLAGCMDENQAIANLNLICSIITAAVFAMIVLLLYQKYNSLMSGCFFVTFWLSPWVVNFARNLYWVEFTWFLPMAIGLLCAWKISKMRWRIFSYCAAFVSVVVKCLCGYEYISTIMLGMISFLLVDLVKAFMNKDKRSFILLFRTTFMVGIAALVGFMTAICIHADLRGSGDVLEGIKTIFEQDVLRRTMGGDLNAFKEELWPSFNASVWETFCRYFKFPRADEYGVMLPSEIIVGVEGNLFPALCIIPLCLFAFDYKRHKLNVEQPAMYVVFFLASISWFCLAKSHSYVHPHMNYVLWYFGYVQICFYVIVSRMAELFQKNALKD